MQNEKKVPQRKCWLEGHGGKNHQNPVNVVYEWPFASLSILWIQNSHF